MQASPTNDDADDDDDDVMMMMMNVLIHTMHINEFDTYRRSIHTIVPRHAWYSKLVT
jgi:hypothetical protein